jgi:hypothetical protein
MGVHVDQTGRHPQTVTFDETGVRGGLQVGADGLDLAVDEQYVRAI